MTKNGKLLTVTSIALLALLIFLAYRHSISNTPAPALTDASMPGTGAETGSPEIPGKQQSKPIHENPAPRGIQPRPPGSILAGVNYAVAFNAATNQAQALEAINRGYAEKRPSALFARTELAGMCRHAIMKPQAYTSDPNNTYKAQVLKFCAGYTDLLDQSAFDNLLLQDVQQGIRARVFAKMERIEKERGMDAAFEEAINSLRAEQDPYAVSQLFDYLGSAEAGANLPSIANNLPNGAGVAYRPQDALHVASEFISCELAGGCGPYQFRTLQLCSGDIACPPGATVRDVYGFTASPAVIQAADVIVARWRALRQCGRYQCGS